MAETKNRAGRPTKLMLLPEAGQFDLQMVANLNPNVSKACLQAKINTEIENHRLKNSGTRKNTKGRNSRLFSR
jgi:hypothetical protein